MLRTLAPRLRRGVHDRIARPAPEALEPRRLLTIFTVNSFADVLSPPAGTVTLRSAIQAANNSPGPDTINIPVAGTYLLSTIGGYTVTDNSAGELAIADAGDLTIQNTSGGTVTINGGGFSRVLDVDPAGSVMPFTVTLSGLVITGGNPATGDGAGVDVHGAANLVLVSCQVTGNTSYSNSYGGGVATEAGSTGNLTLGGTRVSGNASGVDGGGVAGLGSGTVSIVGSSVVEGNSTLGSGGGVYLNGAPLDVVGTTIRDNRALVSGTTSGSGGGIDNAGAGAVTIAGSILQGNSASGNGGGYADAGLAPLTVVNSFVLGNSASGNGGGILAGGSLIALTNTAVGGDVATYGGGLYTSGTGTVRLANDLFTGDIGLQSGGGAYNTASKLIVTGTTFEADRTGFNNGGGLYSQLTSGDVTISNSLFRGDAANFYGGGAVISGGTLELAASRFTGDSAENYSALYASATFAISGSTFDSGRASGAGALGIFNEPGDSLTNCTVAFNTSPGPAVEILFSGVLAMVDDTIDDNVATSGSAGGVRLDSSTVNVQGTIIAHNTASGTPADFYYSGGTLNDKGGNLLTTLAGAGGKFGPGTIVADPKLGPLVDNGGLYAGAPADSQVIPTQALLPGSPAFGKGIAAGAPTIDQRGFGRHAPPSIGAYEPQYAANATPNQVFVENLFEVLFNRVADPTSLAAGAAFLNAGGTPTALAQLYQGTAEFLGDEATRIVQRYLGRTPSAAEVNGLVAYLQAGHTPEQLATFDLGSAEFYQDYGSNNDVFALAAYRTALGRAASMSELAAWDQALANGLPRTAAAGVFLTSQEYLANVISSDFDAYVGRPPQVADVTTFLSAAAMGATTPFFEAVLLAASFGQRT